MQNILVALLVAGLAVGGWWYFSGDGAAEKAAAEQAKAFAADFFATSTPASQTAAAASSHQVTNVTNNNSQRYMQATIHTNLGDITIEFFDMDAPNTVANFTKLAGSGFYDGTKFHRIIEGFMIQGGDPLTKYEREQARWGTGGPGYQFADEIHANNKNVVGTISMANAGPNTNGSQFFINVADNNFLDSKHTVFGKVVAGMDVVQKLQTVETGEADRPLSPVTITGVTLK